jgi:hypothetical protein
MNGRRARQLRRDRAVSAHRVHELTEFVGVLARAGELDSLYEGMTTVPIRRVLFRLGGETFTTRKRMPAAPFAEAARAVRNPGYAGASRPTAELIDNIVEHRDLKRFRAALRSVDLATVEALVRWVFDPSRQVG